MSVHDVHGVGPTGTAGRGSGRRLAVAVLLGVALLGQGAYSFLVTPEPYPAVRMPSFNGAPDPAGLFPTTTVTIVIEYADGSRLEPHVADLMEEFRGTARRGSLDHVFLPENNRTAPRPVDDVGVRAWLARRTRELGHGREARAVQFCWRTGDLDVRTGEYVDRHPCELMRVEL